jgi:hypothetical protein
MRKLVTCCVAALLLTFGANAFSAPVDLGNLASSPYIYNDAQSYGIAKISFDYSYGDYDLPVGQASFRIRRGDGAWLGSFNVYDTSFNMDTDYGPYEANISLAGPHHHFEFILNSHNGLWSLNLDGSDVVFHSTGSTNNPQPDGTSIVVGDDLSAQYFSDESAQAVQNAIDLGWTANTGTEGIGGNGTYQLQFVGLDGATGAFVDNISISEVPEPTTLLVWSMLGLVGLAAGWRRWK